MKIGIVGKKKDSANYEYLLHSMNVPFITTLTPGELTECNGIILPGGGDITPQLFHAKNQGSKYIDTELDLLQLRAFQLVYKNQMPILGICKGMQLINIGLGGSLFQHLKTTSLHTSATSDIFHETYTKPDSFLNNLYGNTFVVNSRHHQAVNKLGNELLPIQWCSADNCIEAICHESLPIFGVQWHPERMISETSPISGRYLIEHFLSFV